MDNITGFIVTVKGKQNKPVKYYSDGIEKTLDPEEAFLGYFWQMTGRTVNGCWEKAHVSEVKSLMPSKSFLDTGERQYFQPWELK